MQQTNRRRLLKTTAAGTATALGVGATSTGPAGGLTQSDQREAVGEFQAETTGGFLTIDANTAAGYGSIFGQLGLSTSTLGAPVEIAGRVYDDGTWDSTRVSVPDITDGLADTDVLGAVESLVEEFSIAGLLDSLDLDEIIVIVSDIVDGLDLTQQQVDRIVDQVTGLLSGLNLGIPSSVLVSVLDSYLSDPDPERLNDLLEGLGIGSIRDILDLADIPNLDQLDVIVQGYLEELDIERIFANETVERFLEAAVLDIGVPEVTGQIDRESGLVTATPAGITLAVGFQDRAEFFDARLPFSISLTTGDSGALSGSTSGLATDSATVTLVDNEFTLGIGELDLDGAGLGTVVTELADAFEIDLGGLDIESLLSDIDIGGIINGIGVGNIVNALLTDEPGRHYLELDLAMEFDTDPLVPGALAGRVTDEEGAPVSGAVVSVLDPDSGTTIETTVTAGDGTYEVAAPAGEQEVTVEAPGFEQFSETVLLRDGEQRSLDVTLSAGPPPLPGFSSEPRDSDGDGLYERVRGRDEFTLLDVQTLFDRLESDAVQNNPESFNFQGEGDDVTILDVQALFNKLQNGS